MTQLPYIADIKRGALDDGPGIRSTVFFKGCPLSCAWCHNPECIGAKPELAYNEGACIDCRDCVEACGAGAIGPEGPSQRIDRRCCSPDCDCTTVCPSGALEIIGRRYEVDELVALLLRDRTFYDSSGGGVTLSGGEATMFCEYAGAVSQQLRAAGVEVLLETCGHFDWVRFSSLLLPHLDWIYFDLKLLDPAQHARHCGRDNRRILDNLRRLAALQGDVQLLVRLPLVPTLTCTRDNLEAAAALLEGLGIGRVALLPYNPLWGPKVRAVGRAPRPIPERWLSAEEEALARGCFGELEVVGLASS